MKKISTKLLIFQFGIGCALVVITLLSPYYIYWQAVMMGAVTSLSGACVAWAIFRRLPKIIGRQLFYSAMIIYELMKWFVIIILTIFFLKYLKLSALGVAIGFIVTYLVSYMSLLRTK